MYFTNLGFIKKRILIESPAGPFFDKTLGCKKESPSQPQTSSSHGPRRDARSVNNARGLSPSVLDQSPDESPNW